MRRAEAILVVLTLLALPLAPLAWGVSCQSAAGPMFCCLMHKMQTPSGKPMICHCPGRSQQQTPEFTMVAPIPPAAAAARVEVTAPQEVRGSFYMLSQTIASGFRSAPFKPPRA
ncbi:MAG: hypothetical protein WCC21_17180 [Candidatus Acidiferrales bacterium]